MAISASEARWGRSDLPLCWGPGIGVNYRRILFYVEQIFFLGLDNFMQWISAMVKAIKNMTR